MITVSFLEFFMAMTLRLFSAAARVEADMPPLPGASSMKRRSTAARIIASILAGTMLTASVQPSLSCTSLVFKAADGTGIYARTMEWGASDLKSEMVLIPRKTTQSSVLGTDKTGISWSNVYGYVGINPAGYPYATDGMNETGLTVGALFYPGFAEYQQPEAAEQSKTLSSMDVVNYLLGNFKTVEEVRQALPKLRVVKNADLEKAFGSELPLHHIVTDSTGASIVVEYTKGVLTIFDNKVGAMTNSPSYDWHLLNLRNYANLKPLGAPANRNINGVSLAPFGAGSGMHGLPGDFTPPSRFLRAVAFVATMEPVKDAAAGVAAASSMLNNFDIPQGLVREGASAEDYHLGFTQWSVIGDTRNKVYYYWTMYDRRMRSIDLTKLNFDAAKPSGFPLDRIRVQDIENRSADFGK
ncbi:linear amide C-N hydrolase [Bosea caraganae]|uniref:Linear amide C-N hydrolase n=2 Tax=Bosea caraganae TaxID=2763117 RepID=A0A370LC31_9HYPH|nr:linear amide C-N hydrolase [Bosea caraganae]RDJ29105.1 linear amide C-N hydrolase [Bosea caraganae]